MTVFDASLGYHNLKDSIKSSYLATFTSQFGNYTFSRLPFGLALPDYMLSAKIDEIFKDLPNVIGIADDILIEGHDADERDHDRTLGQVVQICLHEGLNEINVI